MGLLKAYYYSFCVPQEKYYGVVFFNLSAERRALSRQSKLYYDRDCENIVMVNTHIPKLPTTSFSSS